MEFYRTKCKMVHRWKTQHHRKLPRPSSGRTGRSNCHPVGTKQPERRRQETFIQRTARGGLSFCKCFEKQWSEKRRPHLHLHADGSRTCHCSFSLRKNWCDPFRCVRRIFFSISCRQDTRCGLQYCNYSRWRFPGSERYSAEICY